MGKIIQTNSTRDKDGDTIIIDLSKQTKIGHVIGAKNNLLLCEELDSNYDFVFNDTQRLQRKVFACHPYNIVQVGYLNVNEEILKKLTV
jgi:hypothetical protein